MLIKETTLENIKYFNFSCVLFPNINYIEHRKKLFLQRLPAIVILDTTFFETKYNKVQDKREK